jgi:hypothetical protein
MNHLHLKPFCNLHSQFAIAIQDCIICRAQQTHKNHFPAIIIHKSIILIQLFRQETALLKLNIPELLKSLTIIRRKK